MCGGGASVNQGEIDAKARVAAAAEKARVEAETTAKEAAANKAALLNKESLTDSENERAIRMANLQAASDKETLDKEKAKTFTKTTLLGG